MADIHPVLAAAPGPAPDDGVAAVRAPVRLWHGTVEDLFWSERGHLQVGPRSQLAAAAGAGALVLGLPTVPLIIGMGTSAVFPLTTVLASAGVGWVFARLLDARLQRTATEAALAEMSQDRLGEAARWVAVGEEDSRGTPNPAAPLLHAELQWRRGHPARAIEALSGEIPSAPAVELRRRWGRRAMLQAVLGRPDAAHDALGRMRSLPRRGLFGQLESRFATLATVFHTGAHAQLPDPVAPWLRTGTGLSPSGTERALVAWAAHLVGDRDLLNRTLGSGPEAMAAAVDGRRFPRLRAWAESFEPAAGYR